MKKHLEYQPDYNEEDFSDDLQERDPKILIYDIEVSPLAAWAYDRWQTNLVKVDKEKILLSIAWCWYNPETKKQKLHYKTLYDTDTYKVDPIDDTLLVKDMWDLLDEADLVVGHNSNNFDNKVMNAFFVKHNMKPMSSYEQLDTYRQARNIFGKSGFSSLGLDNLGRTFGIGHKTDVKNGDVWYQCLIEHDPKAWKLMGIYNQQDVQVTINLYERLRPWMKNPPSLARISNRAGICPHCGGTHFNRHFHYAKDGSKQGDVYRTRRLLYPEYECMDCGARICGAKAIKASQGDIRPEFKR